MKNGMYRIISVLTVFGVLFLGHVTSAFAEDVAISGINNLRSIGAGLAIGLAVLGGATGQGKCVTAMLETYGRNPSVGGKLTAPFFVGLALIESLVILGFVIAYFSLSN